MQGIVKMRAAGKLAAQVLEYAGTLVKVSLPLFSRKERDKNQIFRATIIPS